MGTHRGYPGHFVRLFCSIAESNSDRPWICTYDSVFEREKSSKGGKPFIMIHVPSSKIVGCFISSHGNDLSKENILRNPTAAAAAADKNLIQIHSSANLVKIKIK